MAQLFPAGANTLARLSIVGGVLLAASGVGLAYMLNSSPYVTRVNLIQEQPVAFSHAHHVDQLGIDCRYCHVSVETEANAGLPPTYTCMSCHSQVWNDSPMLATVRESLREDKPIPWKKVHDLPDFVYFHHGIHVQKGVSCVTCHGHVEEMPLVWKAEPMNMGWCLNCHKHPENYVRPGDEVFNFAWTPSDEGPDVTQASLGAQIVQDKNIPVDRMTNCSVCHR